MKQRAAVDPAQTPILQIMIPILLENVLRCLMGTVNVLLMSFVSDGAVGAIGIANQYISLAQSIVSSITLGAVVCVTQAIGMGNMRRAGELSTVALGLNVFFGLFFGGVFLTLSGPLLSIMSLEGAERLQALHYMRIVGGGYLITSMSMVFCNLLRVFGQTKMPLVVNILQNALNTVGTYLVILPLKAFFPDPVSGVAWANLSAQFIGAVAALCFMLRIRTGIRLKYLFPFPWKDVRLALSLGVPNSLDGIAYSAGQLVTTSFISGLGTFVVTAKVYVQNIVQYSYQLGMSAGQTGQIMVGYRLGEEKYEEMHKLQKRVTWLALLTNMAFSLVCILFRRPLLSLFTQDERILTLAMAIICVDFFVEIGRAMNNTICGCMRGVGDVKFTMVINLASAWLISVGLSYVLGIWAGWGLIGIWIAFAVDENTRGLILLTRWRSDRWVAGAKKRLQSIAGKAQ